MSVARRILTTTLLVATASAVWTGCGRTRRPPVSTSPIERPAAAPAPAVEAPAPVEPLPEPPSRPAPHRPWFHADANVVRNAAALGPFLADLKALAAGERRKVDVVHMGDSHVQADLMTAALRAALQGEFGAAGRGLVFPHRLAHTNGAADVRWWSNVDWTGRRLSKNGDLPVGASGHGARPDDDGFWLKVGLDGDDADFDRVRLFAGPGTRLGFYDHDDPRILETTFPELPPVYYRIRPGDYLGRIAQRHDTTVRRLKAINGLSSDTIYAGDRLLVRARGLRNGRLDESRFRLLGALETDAATRSPELDLTESLSTVFARSLRARGSQTAPLWGLYLENAEVSGVVVSGVGGNGARYRDYAREPAVVEQVGDLEPSLIVIALGTNEATNDVVDAERIVASVDSVVTAVRRRMPGAALLLCTPPDHLDRRRLGSLKVRQVRRLIVDYAQANGVAWWDLHEVMGGGGSMNRWIEDGLARDDRIHFTPEGYRLLGELLGAALLRAYDRYAAS